MYKEKSCINCNHSFTPNSPKQKYCKDCLIRTCEKCNKSFSVRDPKYFPKFCSMNCYHLSRWNGKREIEKTCKECKKSFSYHVSKNKMFCSKKCYSNGQKKLSGNKSNSWKGGRIRYGTKNNYWAIYQPHHPFADSKGYVMEHRLVMEKEIKRFLLPSEVVHHISSDTMSNEVENLQILTKKDHDRLHAELRRRS